MSDIKNPIYKEHYYHGGEECYKIDMPFSQYKKETMVLCKVSEGIEKAKSIAYSLILERFVACMKAPLDSKE